MNSIEYRKLLSQTLKLIEKYFKDKKDKGGHDYVNHLYAVCDAVEKEASINCVDMNSSLGQFYRKASIVALLHDILEDTDCTEEELKEAGCDEEIIEAIKSVTRRKDEQYYFDFIERASKNDIGRLVKKYDLENNMDIKRLDKFGDYEQKRLKKYWYCWKYLKGEINSLIANNSMHPDRLFR